ncbi:DUF6193 family natural product biosynthesis protein [Streptomyces colonosanans]|uniref:DUF6193 family natural product biosynthesis protein n=1 Tax=Streptomyces colonosanans TaxID=1428652 RepID=UPI001FEA8FCE|nr:DUF6193 family natural product biosynthesis protein [Streptomyces colonosanans]
MSFGSTGLSSWSLGLHHLAGNLTCANAGVQNAALDTSAQGETIVEAGWQAVRAGGRVRAELIEAAYAEPRLWQLFPWTGMAELHFSRCTGHPWTWDIPYVQPALGGGYWVAGPLRDEAVGPAATAAHAIAMVVERLPPHCGPALVGGPKENAAHEAAARAQTAADS